VGNVESTLTALLRQQACRETGSPSPTKRSSSGAQVQVRVHLPPYHGEDTVLVVAVPVTTQVSDFRDEVVRQAMIRAGAASRRGTDALLGPLVRGVFRLFDEDEQEPDYDCPPFEGGLQVEVLGKCDVALCSAGPLCDTPPSPPLSSPGEDRGLASSAATPKGHHFGVLRKVSFVGLEDLELEGAKDPLLKPTPPSAGIIARDSQAAVAESSTEAPSTDADAASPLKSPVERPPRGTSDSVVQARGHVATQPVLSHRRARSLPGAQLQALLPDSGPVVTVGGFETFSDRNARKARSHANLTEAFAGDVGSPRSETGEGEPFDGAPDAALTRLRVASFEVCERRLTQLTLLLPEGTSQAPLTRSASLCAFWPCAAADTPEGSSSSSSSSAHGFDPRGPSDSVVMNIWEEATLLEVLSQLSRDRGRLYDPVSFAFERLEDGIRQRLDLDTQVKHLGAQVGALILVRKDAPQAFPPQADPLSPSRRLEAAKASGRALVPGGGRLDLLPRPSPSAFFFNEYTASIATEYYVAVAVRSSRARPAECTLVVDRHRLYHQASRADGEEADTKKGSFMPPLLKNLRRHLQLEEWSQGDSQQLFAERQVRDIRAISCDGGHQRTFFVSYAGASSAGPGEPSPTVELVYEAQTPTECAEIVARLRFLLTLT